MDKLERARQLRQAMLYQSESLNDQQAAKVPAAIPEWVAGEAVWEGERRYDPPTDRVYKCLQAHTTQPDWTPDKTPALWAALEVTHEGSLADPIPAARGMEYTYGLYYLDPEDGKTYLCQREGEVSGGTVILQYLPHELMGQYFEEPELF